MENFLGTVYPTYDHDELIRTLGIRPSDKVLDIGGGHNPLSRADYIVDFDLADGSHRDGQTIPADLKDRFVSADIHDLPFGDKSIDFIYCSHVLEHVLDPARACRELMRVGRRGFIEAPRKWSEIFAGYPSHQWLIDVEDGGLTFERRQFIASPYMNTLLHAVWRSKELEARALQRYLNVSCVQLLWENSFPFRVDDSGGNNFDYSNPDHAALSHYYFARNIFLGDVPLERGIFHAKKAVEIRPSDERFLMLLAGFALRTGDSEAWEQTGSVMLKLGIPDKPDQRESDAGRLKQAEEQIRTYIEEHGDD